MFIWRMIENEKNHYGHKKEESNWETTLKKFCEIENSDVEKLNK